MQQDNTKKNTKIAYNANNILTHLKKNAIILLVAYNANTKRKEELDGQYSKT